MRASALIVTTVLLSSCGKPAPDPAPERSAAESAKAGPTPSTPPAIDPERLAAKASPDPCRLVDPADVQTVVGLPAPPTAERGTATGPDRSYCRYGWTEDDQARHVDVAWGTALQGDRAKIAKGMELARKDLKERRVQPIEIPGALLATWGDQWLTVYANDQQVLWVIMEASGRTPRDGRNLAAALAAHAVQ